MLWHISGICKQGGQDAIQDTLQQFGMKQDELRTNIISITIGFETAKEELSAKVMSVNNELQNATRGIKSIATELQKTNYFLQKSALLSYERGGTGGWRRVAYLNMTDPNTKCPFGWRLTSHSKRTCGRINRNSYSRDSAISLSLKEITLVCVPLSEPTKKIKLMLLRPLSKEE